MPTLQLEISESEYQQLDEFARLHKQEVEAYAGVHFRQWLAQHKQRFTTALKAVLEENAELYRRLS